MDAKKFGQFIQTLRREQDMTQTQLGEKLGVTDKAVSRWERGVGFPDISLLEPLAQTLEVSVVELIRSERMEEKELPAETVEQVVIQTLDLAEDQWKERQRKIPVMFWITMAMTCIGGLIAGCALFVPDPKPTWFSLIVLIACVMALASPFYLYFLLTDEIKDWNRWAGGRDF